MSLAGSAAMGDGNSVIIGEDGLGTHVYAAAGTYTVTFTPSDGNAPVSQTVEATEVAGNPPWSWPADSADANHYLLLDRVPDNDLSFYVMPIYSGNSTETYYDELKMYGTIYIDAPGNPSARFDGDTPVRFDMLAAGTYRVGFEPDPDLPLSPHGIMIREMTVGPIDRSVEWIDWRGTATLVREGQVSPFAVSNIDLGWPGAAGLWTWSARWDYTAGNQYMNLQIPGSDYGVMRGQCTVGQRFDGGDGYMYEVGILEDEGGGFYINGSTVLTPFKYYKIGRVMPAQVK